MPMNIFQMQIEKKNPHHDRSKSKNEIISTVLRLTRPLFNGFEMFLGA